MRFRWFRAVDTSWLLVLVMLSIAHVGSSHAQAGPPSGLLIFKAGDAAPSAAPKLASRVDIEVHGVVVRARLTQRFSNPTDQWVEGIYVFPMPDGAAVDRLSLRIGERRIEGEIQERQQAEATYRQAREQGRAASLLNQQRPNIFTTSVANIAPYEHIEVEIAFQQRAHWEDGRFSLRFPMVVAPRYIPGVANPRASGGGGGWSPDTDEVVDASSITPPVAVNAPDDFRSLQLEVRLDLGLPIGEIESIHHPIDTELLDGYRYRVRLSDGTVPADRDFVLRWRPEPSAQPRTVMFRESWQGQDYLLLMMMPPDAKDPPTGVGRELVLVVDTSGSMHGESLAQAKKALLRALDDLDEDDAFNVIQFNSSTHSLFADSRIASATNLALARSYVHRLSADGGTEIRAALRRALHNPTEDGRLRQVIFLTDGAVGNEQAAFADIRQGIGRSRLFTVGIGSAPNAYFMRRAARFGRGSYTFIGHTREVESEVGRLLHQISHPVLTDVELDWSGLSSESRVILGVDALPDLYAGQPLVITAMADVAPTGVTVRARRGTWAWRQQASLQQGAQSSGLHALWARQRIASWLDARVSGSDEATIRRHVVQLGLAHQLVSPFTSLVAVDKTPRRSAEASLRRHELAVRLPAGWSARKVFGQLPMTATPAPLLAVAGFVALLAALGLWWQGGCTWRRGAS